MTDLTQTTLTAPSGVDMALVVGEADEMLHLMEGAFDARITVRGDTVALAGDPIEVQQLTALLTDLFRMTSQGEVPDADSVRRAIELLARRYAPEDTPANRDAAIDREFAPLCMLELSIEHLSGKEAIELVKARRQ